MHTHLKLALTASFLIHLMLFAGTSITHLKSRVMVISFPVELMAPKGGGTPEPEAKKPDEPKPPEKAPEKPKPEPVVKQNKNILAVKPVVKPSKGKQDKIADNKQKTPPQEGSQAKVYGSGLMSNISLENANFPYTVYLNNVRRTIYANWDESKPTSTARAVIFFKIQRDGKLADVKIDKSSNNKIFDLIAKRAVELSEMPPLPEDYKGKDLGVYIEFIYRE